MLLMLFSFLKNSGALFISKNSGWGGLPYKMSGMLVGNFEKNF